MNEGFLDEVRGLLDDGLEQWPPLQSVGYKECVQFLKGLIPEDKLVPLIVEKTIQLSKKQKTWFKRESDIHWLPTDDPVTPANHLVSTFLDQVARTR